MSTNGGAIQLSNQDILFLFEENKENIELLKVREFKNLSKENKENYQRIYNDAINSQFIIDWQCSGCVVDNMIKLYSILAPFADKIELIVPEPIEPIEPIKPKKK